jgi:hypothetical protein
MTPSESQLASQVQTEAAVAALMVWITAAQKSLAADKMDGMARARLGELIINACRYLGEREVVTKKAKDKAEYDWLPSTLALREKLNSLHSSGQIS